MSNRTLSCDGILSERFRDPPSSAVLREFFRITDNDSSDLRPRLEADGYKGADISGPSLLSN